MTVLKVLEREKLGENARVTGDYLVEQIQKKIQKKYKIVGDVRGNGFFVGIDLISDTVKKTPLDSARVSKIVNLMKEFGVFLGSTGIFSNVLKVRPPMCFSREDADFLIERLDHVLGSVVGEEVKNEGSVVGEEVKDEGKKWDSTMTNV